MGIYDRDYVRREPPRPGSYGTGGVRSMRMWSVNTWLIVICVAVFVIDGVLKPVAVQMGRSHVVGVEVPEGTTLVRAEAPDWPSHLQRLGRQPQSPDDFTVELPVFAGAPGGEVVAVDSFQFMRPIESVMHFSTARGFLGLQFWRLVGFQFLHSHGMLAHIVFNMVGLFFFGPIVEQYLGRKRYLAFYLLCGICGALLYAILNVGGIGAHQLGMSIPGLLFNRLTTPLIGASAGVFGVIMAGAYLVPNARVLLFFVLPLRLKTLAYGLVGLAAITLFVGARNAGGEAGHLGGAIAGWYFIRHTRHLHGFFDILGRIDPTSHHYRRPGRQAHVRAGVGRTSPRLAGRRNADQAIEIDRILDKIRAGGLQSLTDREKQILRKASEE
jgi:membrane associated rhomboid family serine protease